MSERITVGNVEVTCLTDTTTPFPVPATGLFPTTTEQLWEPYRREYAENFTAEGFLRVHIGCYLLRSAGRTILVDTGLGPAPIEMLGGARGHLVDDLARKLIDPDDVDTVVHTHLHFDHVGWNVDEGGRPRFRRARYVCPAADWEFFQVPEVQAAMPPGSFDGPLKPLEAAGVVDLVSGEHALTPEVTLLPTPGHTPGHQSILISSAGERAVLTGDAVVHPAQVTHTDWAFAFDADAAQAIATRESLLTRIEAEGLKVIACHFPSPGFGQVVRLDGTRYWRGAE